MELLVKIRSLSDFSLCETFVKITIDLKIGFDGEWEVSEILNVEEKGYRTRGGAGASAERFEPIECSVATEGKEQ